MPQEKCFEVLVPVGTATISMYSGSALTYALAMAKYQARTRRCTVHVRNQRTDAVQAVAPTHATR